MPSAVENSPMIEWAASEGDDIGFLEIAARTVNGALADLQVCEVYLVRIDNWFDFKWLGWWSSWKHGELTELCVPAFNPNRVRSQDHFVWDVDSSRWIAAGHGTPLHVHQLGLQLSNRRMLRTVSKSAAFIWYSGNTLANRVGSLMVYQSGAEDYAWYAGFAKKDRWIVGDGNRISRSELKSFDDRGRQMEVAPTQARLAMTRSATPEVF